MDNNDDRARVGIVAGRPVSRIKQERAPTFRKQMTPEETQLWQQLRARRLDGLHWRRQQVIGGFIADFYCHAVGIVIEIDGAVHLQQAEYDRARDEVFARSGLLVLRITNTEVNDHLGAVLARIRAACQERIR